MSRRIVEEGKNLLKKQKWVGWGWRVCKSAVVTYMLN